MIAEYGVAAGRAGGGNSGFDGTPGGEFLGMILSDPTNLGIAAAVIAGAAYLLFVR